MNADTMPLVLAASLLGAIVAGLAIACWGLRQAARRDATQAVGLARLLEAFDRLDRGLREQMQSLQTQAREEQRLGRDGVATEIGGFELRLQAQLVHLQATQTAQLERLEARLQCFTERTEAGLGALRDGLGDDARKGREESAAALSLFGTELQRRFTELGDGNERRLGEVRATLEGRLGELQRDNAAKLEQMRHTVDEKLQATLETRLGESFRLVSERLEQVHRGLGEMQSLATGVGDLKRVLGNVKSRGVWGEVQLAGVLEQVLTPDQYAANVATRPGSAERVEYAVRLPGTSGGDAPVWLPIDAKFPREDYERLLDAQDRADADGAALAAAAMERRIRDEARQIAAKYVEPPHTTDFALLFLPTEGLYAEVLRRPGLVETLQREQRVVIAGPTTLAAILNSLRMGFRTLAIERRSSEAWQVLGAVKTEFGKFGEVLARTRKKLTEAANVIDQADVRTRAITRSLRGVEAATPAQAQRVLGDLPALDLLPADVGVETDSGGTVTSEG